MMCGYKYGGVTCLFSQSFDMVQEFSHGKSNDSAAGDDKNEGDICLCNNGYEVNDFRCKRNKDKEHTESGN